MAIGKSCEFKTEGGQGGRRGHSNMTHYERTEILKKDSAKLRRHNARKLARQAKFDLMMA